MRYLFGLVLALCLFGSARADVKIVGDVKVPEHGLVRLKADGADPKAGLVWRVTPSKAVSKATSPKGVLEFAAPPGDYTVDLLAVRTGPDGQVIVEESSVTVTIEKPKAVLPPAPKPTAAAAICRLSVGSRGCTATVVYPRRPDGKWDILTASHCTDGVGSKGKVTLKDGRVLAVTVSARNVGPDIAWLVTDDATLTDLPYAVLAKEVPAPGTTVWHAGYGVDKPGNREEGEVGALQSVGKTNFNLSVSSGDSGGGIFRVDTNELLATVCCTSSMAHKGSMWGGNCVTAAKMRPVVTALAEDEQPGCCGR